MEILRHVVVFLHIIAFAVLFGSWLVEAVGRRIQFTRLMSWGMALAAVTGLALAAPWGVASELSYTKIAVKLVVLLIIGAILGIGTARQKRTGSLPAALFYSVGALALINAGLAVIWR